MNHPIRPPTILPDSYHPVPPTAYGPGARSPSMRAAAMNCGFEGVPGLAGDYFGLDPYSQVPSPRSPYQPGYPPDSYLSSPYDVEELVRKQNLAVQMVNGQISHSARYSQLQPKLCVDGKPPLDFRSAKTVEEVKVMDGSTLERILQAYRLPTDLRTIGLTSRDVCSTSTARDAKRCTLYDFLGATRLAEHERRKRQQVIAY